MANELVVYLVGLAGGIAGLVFLFRGLERRERRKKFQSATEVDVADLSEERAEELKGSHVRTSGRVQPADEGAFPAPFTGYDALYTDWMIKEDKEIERDRNPWRIVDSGTVRRRASLETDDGSVQMAFDRNLTLEISPSPSATMVYEPDQEFPGRIRDFHQGEDTPGKRDHRVTDDLISGYGRRKYLETRIEPGDELHCYGKLWTDKDGALFKPTYVSDRTFETLIRKCRPRRAELVALFGGLLAGGSFAAVFLLVEAT